MKGKIVIDFEKDMIAILKNELKYYGFDLIKYPDEKIRFLNFNFNRRLIFPKARNVLVSNEFKCPTDYEEGLELVKKKILNGEDLFLHLSARIKKIKFDDDLLNEWKIYHLHLGTEIAKKGSRKGFIKGTEFVLYLYVDEDNAYLINVLDHCHFNDQELVAIIHNNWPFLIKRYLNDGEFTITNPPTNEDIKEIRKNHSVYFFEPVPGKVYFPMGMGNSTSGLSNEVVRIADDHFMYTRQLESIAKEIIEKRINIDRKLKSKYKLYVKLRYVEEIPYAFITNVPGYRIRLE